MTWSQLPLLGDHWPQGQGVAPPLEAAHTPPAPGLVGPQCWGRGGVGSRSDEKQFHQGQIPLGVKVSE